MVRWFVDQSPQRGAPSLSLRRLLPEAQFLGGADCEISGCSSDTARLAPGQVYVAIKGEGHDGHTLVAHAIERGAAGVVVERPSRPSGRLQVVVPDARAAHARILHALAGDPSQGLKVVGVTGSRGKGVTGLFLQAIFEAAGVRTGGISKLGWSDGQTTRPIGPEFPSPEGLASMLSTMHQRGSRGAVVELTDEDLTGTAVADGVRIEAAVVTHVRDLDDCDTDNHQARRRAYARLIRRIAPGGTVIVNADDPDAEVLGGLNLDARRLSFGIENEADLVAKIEHLDADGSKFRLLGLDREFSVEIRLPGIDRVRQALAAAATALACGIPSDAIVFGLRSVSQLPGRFEAVEEGQEFEVRIDQAQTRAELGHALAALRAIRPHGRIICVIGSEGLGKGQDRRALAESAEEGADQIIITSNNPRTEDPGKIAGELLAACRFPDRVLVEPDRRSAIEKALGMATPGDAVLIAGKGRNNFQILEDRVIPFDDRGVASQWIRSRQPQRRRTSA